MSTQIWYKDTVNNKLLNVLSSPTCRHKKHKTFNLALQIAFFLRPTTNILSSSISRQKEGKNILSQISTGLSKKMDGIWNRYNLKSTGRIYTFGVLKCSEKFKVLDLP